MSYFCFELSFPLSLAQVFYRINRKLSSISPRKLDQTQADIETIISFNN